MKGRSGVAPVDWYRGRTSCCCFVLVARSLLSGDDDVGKVEGRVAKEQKRHTDDGVVRWPTRLCKARRRPSVGGMAELTRWEIGKLESSSQSRTSHRETRFQNPKEEDGTADAITTVSAANCDNRPVKSSRIAGR